LTPLAGGQAQGQAPQGTGQARDGAIILLHEQRYDGAPALATVEALPGIIEDLRGKGYGFVEV